MLRFCEVCGSPFIAQGDEVLCPRCEVASPVEDDLDDGPDPHGDPDPHFWDDELV